jgi:hypothetical protein
MPFLQKQLAPADLAHKLCDVNRCPHVATRETRRLLAPGSHTTRRPFLHHAEIVQITGKCYRLRRQDTHRLATSTSVESLRFCSKTQTCLIV